MPTAGHPIVVAKNRHRTRAADGAGVRALRRAAAGAAGACGRRRRLSRRCGRPKRADAVYARGAVDDKGQVWCHVEAIRAWQAHGGVPVNLTLLIEGEEEIGSDHLAEFVQKHQRRAEGRHRRHQRHQPIRRGLAGDHLRPARAVLRGSLSHRPDHDLHSGLYGGAVPNPANVLCELSRRCTIPTAG